MTDSQSTPKGAPAFENPSAGLTPMEVSAIGLHEVFTAYVKAGFSEDQSLTIIARMAGGGRG